MLIKTVLILLGSGLLLNCIFLLFISSFNLGKILSFILALVLLFYGIFFDQINGFMSHGVLLWLRYIIYLCFCFMLVIIGFLGIYGQHDNVTYQEDAVIVLGAGLRGDQVSLTLAQRLDAAIAYHEKNPRSVIVVSGGQGANELIPEAKAMAKYLEDHNIPRELILEESDSSSTKENFIFSDRLIRETLDDKYTLAYITNGFHIYRAGLIAESVGLKATHFHGALTWYMFPSCYLRELLAVCYQWFL